MPKGQVKWFDPKKGFGFIIGPEGKDIFVHYTHVVGEGYRTLNDGELVEYELVQTDKGLQAHNVVRQQVAQTPQPPSLKQASPAEPAPQAAPTPADTPPPPAAPAAGQGQPPPVAPPM
jgi:CspA family cold shock protein